MNKSIKLGELNILKVNRVSEPGIYLVAENEEEVLLPNIYVKASMNVGTSLEVFIYTDSEDRLVATTLTPYGIKGDYVALEVIDIAKFGAFLDMGLPKDLLIPKNKQKSDFQIGNRKVVQIIEDEKTNRLIANEKFNLSKETENFLINDEVDILLYTKTPLGFKVVVNNCYEGLIYHNEIFEKANTSDKKRGYVKNIREDGKLDISLQKIGFKKNDETSLKVIEILKNNNGELPFNYKSDADDIKETFSMSKKAFKSSLTKLLEKNKIHLDENGIKLI